MSTLDVSSALESFAICAGVRSTNDPLSISYSTDEDGAYTPHPPNAALKQLIQPTRLIILSVDHPSTIT